MSNIIKIILLLLLLFPAAILPQEEEEGDSTAYLRYRWFSGQRCFPYDSIPRNSYRDAIIARNYILSQGYFLYNQDIWHEIGPKPLFTGWDNNNSGRGSVVEFDPNNSATFYLGAGNGGVWRTTNAGNNWEPLTDYLVPSLSSGALAIENGNPNVIYYGTGEAVDGILWTYLGLGIYKTTDGGQSWYQLTGNLPTTGTKVYKIAINPANPDIVFTAMNLGLWRSSDAGSSWTRVVPTQDIAPYCTDVVISPTNPDIVYCAGPNYVNGGIGYRKSTDGGITFNEINDPVFQPVRRTVLAISNSIPNILYATTNIPTEERPPYTYMNIYKSTNGSGTDFFVASCLHEGFQQVEYDLCLDVSPHNPDIVFCGILHLFRSTDGGANFNYIAGYKSCGRSNPGCPAVQHILGIHIFQICILISMHWISILTH